LVRKPVFACLVLYFAFLSAVAIRPMQAEPVKDSIPLTAAQLQAVSGEYTDPNEPDTPLSFYAREGNLYLESERQIPTQLSARSANEFEVPKEPRTYSFSIAASGISLKIAGDGPGQDLRRTGDAVHHLFHHYDRTVADIPARDGVKLHLVILTPTDMPGPLPILLSRTPYSVDGNSGERFFQQRPELAREGYIYVNGDIRGRFGSDGTFVMMHPLTNPSDPKATDESTDAYDTIDWAVKNLPKNNGRVGVLGTSYPGFLSMMAGIHPHPAVKAISPQAPMIDVWMGDDFFHNGAFRQTYGYDYAIELESSKGRTEVSYGQDAQGNPRDGYDFFLERGSFAEDMKRSGVQKELPTWQAFTQHPSYDSVWQAKAVWPHLTEVSVPTLTVGGYYDQEDMYGPQQEYTSLEPHDSKHANFLVLGPWRHGSWGSPSRHLGALQYGESIGNEYRSQIEAKFFAKYLKDQPGFDLEDTASFQTGSNSWKRYPHFPPAEAKPTALFLCGTGAAALNSPCPAGPVDRLSYVSDPANPVPYRHRPIQPTYADGSKWGTWMVEDQRFATDRKDVAIWRLPVQTSDLTITGEVIADIFASTTGSDGDFVAKLIDVYPDDEPDPAMRGYQLMTNMEIFRGRYRSSFDHPEALKSGDVNEFKWSLHDVDHVFKKGHTVMVEIQSTWFPLYDRNPQTFVPNIMLAKPGDYKPATITIINDPRHPSQITLPVMP
jgi:putative CocE/NonD family hydrolase